MAAGDIDLYYLDACIFYEHLNGEPVPPLKKQAIDNLFRENRDKRNRICTSAVSHLEVLPKKLVNADKEKEYWANFDSMYFFDIEADRAIIGLARDIKNFYYVAAVVPPPAAPAKPGQGAPAPTPAVPAKMLSTGDAIHVATAVIHKVKELWTRDNNRRNGNVKLLGLPESSPNGKICGVYDLKIVNPEAVQGDLLSG